MIDTTKVGFYDDFCNYLQPIKPFAWLHTKLPTEKLEEPEKLTRRPGSLAKRLGSYELK